MRYPATQFVGCLHGYDEHHRNHTITQFGVPLFLWPLFALLPSFWHAKLVQRNLNSFSKSEVAKSMTAILFAALVAAP